MKYDTEKDKKAGMTLFIILFILMSIFTFGVIGV